MELRPSCQSRLQGFQRQGRIGRRGGFTLIEILVVVLILGILSMMVVPCMGSRNDLKAAAAARAITADLLYAQNRAIATSSFVYVSFDQTNNRYSLLSAMPSSTITQPVTQAAYTISMGPGGNMALPDCSISNVSFDSQPVLAFDALGTPYAVPATAPYTPVVLNAGSVTIQCGPNTATVLVDPITGQIRIQ